ncbi:hypothetical protein DYST_03711 [Dyella terrae]|nr:hypothetical protein DYST_03711 [Dyella terrae]
MGRLLFCIMVLCLAGYSRADSPLPPLPKSLRALRQVSTAPHLTPSREKLRSVVEVRCPSYGRSRAGINGY